MIRFESFGASTPSLQASLSDDDLCRFLESAAAAAAAAAVDCPEAS